MNNQEFLSYIANGIYAAQKIRGMQDSYLRRDENATVRSSGLEVINDIIKVIAEYFPGNDRSMLDRITYTSEIYSNAYRGLKSFITESRGKSPDINSIMRLLVTMKPILGNNQKVMIDKVTRIYEIITT